MTNKKDDTAPCCSAENKAQNCCRIESMITIDERGQMVLPKDLRNRAGIRPGDKFVLVSWEKEGDVCCITLIKAEDLSSIVQDYLGPVMSELSR